MPEPAARGGQAATLKISLITGLQGAQDVRSTLVVCGTNDATHVSFVHIGIHPSVRGFIPV